MQALEYISALPKLRTLNIRNMPEMSNLLPFMDADAMIKGLALSFVAELKDAPPFRGRFTSIVDEEGSTVVIPSIDTLSFGALTYRDVRDASMEGYVSPRDDYLTLRTYSIEYHRTYEGINTPVLTQIAKGSTSNLDATHRKVNILEPYWLA